MADITPTEFLRWARAGDATAPGRSKAATGFIDGEAPGAEHLNYVVQTLDSWTELICSALGPQIAFGNTTFAQTQIGSAGYPEHIGYLSQTDTWYAIWNNGSVTRVYWTANLEDGWTFGRTGVADGAARVTSRMCHFDNGFSQFIAFADGDTVYSSSDETVAGFGTGSSTTFRLIDDVQDLVILDNGIAIGFGDNGGTGTIERASSPTNWTSSQATTGSGTALAMASDGIGTTGTTVATFNDATGKISTDGGITFGSMTGHPAVQLVRVEYVSAWTGGGWLGVSEDDEVYYSPDGDTWTDLRDQHTLPHVHNFIVGTDFVWAWTPDQIDYDNLIVANSSGTTCQWSQTASAPLSPCEVGDFLRLSNHSVGANNDYYVVTGYASDWSTINVRAQNNNPVNSGAENARLTYEYNTSITYRKVFCILDVIPDTYESTNWVFVGNALDYAAPYYTHELQQYHLAAPGRLFWSSDGTSHRDTLATYGA